MNIRIVFMQLARLEPNNGRYGMLGNNELGVLHDGIVGFTPFPFLRFSTSPPCFFDSRYHPDLDAAPIDDQPLYSVIKTMDVGGMFPGEDAYVVRNTLTGELFAVGTREWLLELYAAVGAVLDELSASGDWEWKGKGATAAQGEASS